MTAPPAPQGGRKSRKRLAERERHQRRDLERRRALIEQKKAQQVAGRLEAHAEGRVLSSNTP